MKNIIMITLFLTLMSCHDSKHVTAEAIMQPKSGSQVSGKIFFKQAGDKLLITSDVKGLTPNQKHGFHIHEKGDCSARDASSAGGHFAPMEHSHGAPGDKKHHAGDLGNIEANAYGIAKVGKDSNSLSLIVNDKKSIIGKAVIIHKKSDDLKSQPSGSAGARIACGIITI